MELTTENIIKIAIGVFVIVTIVLGVYFAMKFYVIPYFSGIGFEEPKIDVNSEFGKELMKDENLIGTVDEKGYFVLKDGTKTDIYFKKGKVYMNDKLFGTIIPILSWIDDNIDPDTKIGSYAEDGKITISRDDKYGLNNAYRNGPSEIRKIQ